MDENVLHILEFEKIIERVKTYAASSLAKEKLSSLLPITDRELIKQWQEETASAIELILQYNQPPLFGIYETKSALLRAVKGGVLSAGQLLHIAEGLRVARALQDYAKDAETTGLVEKIHLLFQQKGMEEEITNAILSEDEISDSASNQLFRIRRSMKAKHDQIKTQLNKIMMQAAKGGHLRDNIITMREGRYVLPVKQESRRSIAGIVHDQSGSGATVFIEPMAVIDLNNEIRQLEVEEQEEIHRILASFSAEVAEFAEELMQNQDLLQHIDFTFAKAKYALATHANRPHFTSDRTIFLDHARHPLLGGNVVPITIQLGEGFNTLIITGPNTGGKTVTLKTLGLLTLMAQAGLHIPARETSKVGIFSSIYADIGDKQSIEMSLSTFSASMTNIVSIMEKADENSLVLFDELGAGTDPTEGAALAMSILERLTDCDIRTVATTHYSELKLFAIKQKGVQNASVEFDVETLSPTYRLIIGMPGRSNAFEIARRLGLPQDILEDAQKHLDHESIQFEDVLADIERNRLQAQKDRAEADRMRRDYEQQLRQRKAELDKARAQYEKEKKNAALQAKRIVEEAEAFAQGLIKDAKAAKKGDRPDLDRALSHIHEEAASQVKKYELKHKIRQSKTAISDIRMGQTVEVISMGQRATIIQEPNKNGDVQVQMGILKMKVNVKDIVLVEDATLETVQPSTKTIIDHRKNMEMSIELDLRGERYEQAIDRVDKYLDDAVLAGFKDVRIIHGKGTGALRKGITDFLRSDKRVLTFGLADYKQGGAGVTEVKLK